MEKYVFQPLKPIQTFTQNWENIQESGSLFLSLSYLF